MSNLNLFQSKTSIQCVDFNHIFLHENLENLREFFEQHKRKVLILNRLEWKVCSNEFGYNVTMGKHVYDEIKSGSILTKYVSFPQMN